MPADPPQGQIDEDAARRAIRRRLIFGGVGLLVAVLVGNIAGLILVHRPGFVHHSFNTRAFVLSSAIVVTIIAVSIPWLRRLLHRPAYRRVMQYGDARNQRVFKDLVHGRPVSPEDMPVATALVDLSRRNRRWLMITLALMIVVFLLAGVLSDGFLRWLYFGLGAFFVVALALAPRDQRRLIRNFERLSSPTVDEHPDDVTS
jgi:hypothetical protein